MFLQKNNPDIQKKYITVPFEIKLKTEDDEFLFFEGYGSTFGNIDFGNDIIERGAFRESLQKRMPKLLWQHNIDDPIGIFLEAFEDEKGLFVKGKLPKEDSLVKGRVIPQMKVGSIDSMSIGFSVIDQEFVDDIRKIQLLDLFEVSLVTLPMNPEAAITAIKAIAQIKSLKDLNKYLHKHGLSRNQTEGVMSKMKEIINSDKDILDEGKLHQDNSDKPPIDESNSHHKETESKFQLEETVASIQDNIVKIESLTKTIKEKKNGTQRN